ncbi:MAG: hypothetical protein DBY32_09035 [Phascolarctobacterium sp.]|nr:MAG: hypothetical protein DBY32_09035 [Phascolarctobacterium sp.]
MSKYVLLKNSGEIEVKELDKKLELETMYKWIGNDCRCIDIAESVINKKMGCNVLMIFDDEFLLNNLEPVPNKIASLLFGYSIRTSDCLCGNVILAKADEDETVGFTDEEIAKLMRLIKITENFAPIIKFRVQEPRMTFIPGDY